MRLPTSGTHQETGDPRAQLMLAFPGTTLPAAAAERLRAAPAAGVTLFHYHNVESPAQVRELCAAIQRAAASGAARGALAGGAAGPSAGMTGPLLIAADQEGGQLAALAGTTPFPGAMALGATGDPDLAEAVGRATGTELLALGVNVAYAPVCDLATNPANPAIGIRSFGSEPEPVAALVAATVGGLRSAGVAVAAKHFPGLGEAGQDSHHTLPTIALDRADLDRAELVPFRAAIDAGADLVMSAHVALPAITGDPSLPGTLARRVMHDLLRNELGFTGLVITDALDMAALPQGDDQVLDVVAAIRAGIDLLLCAPDPATIARVERGLVHAASRRLLDPDELAATAARLAALRARLATAPTPDPAVVASGPHLALAREVAARAITLVRDDDGVLPLRLGSGARILSVMPMPRDLTPADTSASIAPGLAAALRARWPDVDEIVTGHPPTDADIAAVAARVAHADAVVVGTIAASADPAQARLVDAILVAAREPAARHGDAQIPVVTLALRAPWDLAAYPAARIHVATYGILPPSLEAAAAALFGGAPCRGRLPVPVPGLYPVGHGLARGPAEPLATPPPLPTRGE